MLRKGLVYFLAFVSAVATVIAGQWTYNVNVWEWLGVMCAIAAVNAMVFTWLIAWANK